MFEGRSTDEEDVEVTRSAFVGVGGVDGDGWHHKGGGHGGGDVVEYDFLSQGEHVDAELGGEDLYILGGEIAEAVEACNVGELNVLHHDSNMHWVHGLGRLVVCRKPKTSSKFLARCY